MGQFFPAVIKPRGPSSGSIGRDLTKLLLSNPPIFTVKCSTDNLKHYLSEWGPLHGDYSIDRCIIYWTLKNCVIILS